MAEIRTLKLNLLADVDQFNKGLNKAQMQTGKFAKNSDNFSKKLSNSFKLLAAAAGAAAIKIGTDAVKAAIADQESQVILAKALKNTTKATDKQIKSTEDWITRQQKAYGIADTKLRPALGNLARATGNVEQSQKLASLAMNISASTGKDLESVSLALGKAYNGNIGALTKLGIPLDENIKKTKDFNLVSAQLEQMFAGAAAESAKTFAGRLRILGTRVDELKESLGYILLPVVETFVDYANQHVVPALEKMRDGFAGLNTNAKDSNVAFGMSLKGLTVAFNDFFAQFKSNSSVFSIILTDITVKITRLTDVLSRATQIIDWAKRKLGISTQSTSNAATAESRDAARASGRSSIATANTSIATSFDKISKSSSKAAQKVSEVAQAFASYKSSIKESITGAIDFQSAFQDKGKGSFMDALRRQARLAYDFGGKIAKLTKMGLSRGALSQIIAAGPEVGSQIASELLSGGAGVIGEANSLIGGIESFSNQVSQYATAGVSGRGKASLGGNAINITINGAVDPQGTAKALEKLFQDAARRSGSLSFAGATL